MIKRLTTILIFIYTSSNAVSQVDQNELGAWYMYFFNTTIKKSSWGFQGDMQHRNWNFGKDLEQLLLRGGVTYKPQNSNIKFTLGYGNITTGVPGDDNSTSSESRIYQEALFSGKVGRKFFLNHRVRFEQRLVENQDFRTRFRYNLFMNVPLNAETITKKTVYLALYNEIFINGERNIGNNRSVEIFDRNRLYGALGYGLKSNLNLQLGLMQQTTNSWKKNQIQLSLHHKF